jgi:phosphoribosyl 1,2-cyclic phosphodiesterase
VTLTVNALASGSNGNALLVRAGNTAILIDCGLALRTTERYLRQHGVEPGALTAVLLTHEHGDHSHSAGAFARRHRVPVACNEPTLRALGSTLDGAEVLLLDAHNRLCIGGIEVTGFAVAHDAAAPLGFLLTCCAGSVGLAIDLGGWDEGVAEALALADLVIVEANHDRERLLAAPYPWGIKHRIMSPTGHLDNMSAGALLARIGRDGRKRTAWLGHLSEQANSPTQATRAVKSCLRQADVDSITLGVADRTRPSAAWSSNTLAEQLTLF